MEIPCTQTTLCTSHSKQGYIKSGGNNGPFLKRIATKRTSKVQCRYSMLWLLLIFTPTSMACPPGCSCNALTATCSHQRYTETPIGFSSQIEKLFLYNDNITLIRSETLRPLQKLKLLDLSGNRISNHILYDGIFSNMGRLENLMLQENKLTRIPRNLFKGLTKLARIYLQHNRIGYIEPGAFDNLPGLVELKLAHNRLESFPRLDKTPQLRLLDLSYNRIGTIKDLAFATVNLEYLKLQGNRLTQLRTSLFDVTSRLTKLDISNNRLTAVPQVIKSFTSLNALNMSLNKVGSISKDTFKGMTRLKLLDIHRMGLTELPYGIIPRGTILNLLDITENNWSCGCHMYWLPEYMSIFRDAFIEPSTIRCSTSSKLSNKKIESLTTDDFGCTEAELAESPDSTASTSVTPKPAISATTKGRWFPNPCAVFRCEHGGRCVVEGRRPKCRCTRYWTGLQCRTSLTSPTVSVTPTSPRTPTTSEVTTQKPKLFIKEDSITGNSVEIIVPITERELDVTILEIGSRKRPTSKKIKPKAQPYTIEGLESGKSYNICIHLPLMRKDESDTLCGLVRTEKSKETTESVEDTKIRIVPGPDDGKMEENDNFDAKPENNELGVGDQYSSNNEPAETGNADFKVIYPAVGAGVGAIIILSVLVLFFVCYRHKKLAGLKSQISSDYVPGSPMEPSLNDMEMTTVVHHHHHNHYNSNQNGKDQKLNKKIQNAPKSMASQRSSSLGRNSVASSSNSGTVQSRFTDTPQHYQQYVTPTPNQHYDSRPNGRSDYMYRPNNNNPQNMHCVPVNHQFETDMVDDTQPMLVEMGHYPPYIQERPLYQDLYPANHRNAHQGMPISPYPQNSPRSAFQPIQGGRKRTPTSDSGPITTHANTAHIMPTSACLSRNIISDNILRYPEGVPVV